MRGSLMITALLLALATLRSGAQLAKPPGGTAVVELESQEATATAPVVIDSIRTNGEEVGKSPFPVDPKDPWLKHLSLRVVNRSTSRVDGIEIQIFFPETGTGSKQNPFVGYQYQWGATVLAVKNVPLTEDHAVPVPLELVPGGSASIDLGLCFNEYEQLLRSHMGSLMPTRVEVYVLGVTFSNGVEWSGNKFFRRLSDGTQMPVDVKEMLQ